MGNPLTKAVGNVLTKLMGNVLTEQVGKVLDIYRRGHVYDKGWFIDVGKGWDHRDELEGYDNPNVNQME